MSAAEQAAAAIVASVVSAAVFESSLSRPRDEVPPSEQRRLPLARPSLDTPLGEEGLGRAPAVCLDELQGRVVVAGLEGLRSLSLVRERAPSALPVGAAGALTAVAMGLQADGRTLVAAAGRGELRVARPSDADSADDENGACASAAWAYPEGEEESEAASVAFGETASLLVVALSSGRVCALAVDADADTLALRCVLSVEAPARGAAPLVHVLSGFAERSVGDEPTPEPRGFAVAHEGESAVRVFAVTLSDEEEGGAGGREADKNHEGLPEFEWELGSEVTATAVDDTTARLAVGTEDGGVFAFSTVTGMPVAPLRRHTARVDSVTFSSASLVSVGGGRAMAHALPAFGERVPAPPAPLKPLSRPDAPVADLLGNAKSVAKGGGVEGRAGEGTPLVVLSGRALETPLLADARTGRAFARLDTGGLARLRVAVGSGHAVVVGAHEREVEVPLEQEEEEVAAAVEEKGGADEAPPEEEQKPRTRTEVRLEWHALVFAFERALRGVFPAVDSACMRAWRGDGFAANIFARHSLEELESGDLRAEHTDSHQPLLVRRFLSVESEAGSTAAGAGSDGTAAAAAASADPVEGSPFHDPATVVYEQLKRRAATRSERTARLERRKGEIAAELGVVGER